MSDNYKGLVPGAIPAEQDRTIFTVGDPALTQDVLVGERRFLLWESSPNDDRVSDLAGWKHREVTDIALDEALRSIEIPRGTRPASALIAGFETFEGEKREVLHRFVEYQEQVQRRTGAIDIGVTLGTAAVSREGDTLFFVPPHKLSHIPENVVQWHTDIVSEATVAFEDTTSFENPELILTSLNQSLARLTNKKEDI